MDIISLQKINEAYGRNIGDKLLEGIRDWVLSQNIPHSDLYRIGGDEFCLAVQESDPRTMRRYAQSLSRRFSKSWVFDNDGIRQLIFVSINVGVVLDKYLKSTDSLLNMIERTLATAKTTGKLTVYDEHMDRVYKHRLQIELSLKKSVRRSMSGFEVHYQPIVDLFSGKWIALEALCRWNSPDLGPVSPSMFIPEAERAALIGTIGLWVLEESVMRCKSLGLDTCPEFNINVNVSSIQFSDETLAPKIKKILQRHNFPGNMLCLEITESTAFTFTDLSLKTLDTLREIGVLVALDDFGTGYSNFNNLNKLPIDLIKIERDFVVDLETNNYHQYLIGAMVDLAHNAGKALVAEGVENESQMNMLSIYGADYLQGYLFSKPIPYHELAKRLENFSHWGDRTSTALCDQ